MSTIPGWSVLRRSLQILRRMWSTTAIPREISRAYPNQAPMKAFPLGMMEAIMNAIIQGMDLLKENYDEALCTGSREGSLEEAACRGEGYPLMKRLKSLLDGRIVQNNTIQGAFLIPYDNENLS